ncbi:MAG: HAD family hydrolase [Candidatus Bathyarchaeia archaeon]|nr:HAD family hydrolase [Candidatus Bathyarchaeota archaeon]
MRYLLFIDFDNTLHDTDSKYVSRLNGLLGFDGSFLWDIFLNKIHRMVHVRFPGRHDDLRFHVELLLEALGRRVNVEDVERFMVALEEAERACWMDPAYFPDALDFLRKVSGAGYILCLTTGPNSAPKARALEERISFKVFHYVFGEDTLGCLKSEPEYYRRALKAAGGEPSSTVTVGDTLSTDIAPAKMVGLRTIWVNRKGSDPWGSRVKPDYTVKDLDEAFERIQELFPMGCMG